MAVLAVDQHDLGKAMKTLIRTLMYPEAGPLSSAQRARVEGMTSQTATAMRTAPLVEAAERTISVGDATLNGSDVRAVLYGLAETTVTSGHEVEYLGENVAGHRVAVNGHPATITRSQAAEVLSESDDAKLRKAAKKMAKGDKAAEAKFYQNMKRRAAKKD